MGSGISQPSNLGESTPRIDNLKRIQGISPVIESQLHGAGVFTYAQLASLTPDQIALLLENLPLLSAERVSKQDWPGQARVLAQELASNEPAAAAETLEYDLRHADHFRTQPLEPHADAERAESVASEPSGVPPATTAYAGDDLPISSDQPTADLPWLSAPSYGEMGAPTASPGRRSARPERGAASQAQLLDAWYAAHGHPAITALLRRPEIAALVPNLHLEADERQQVDATEAYPWRCICMLNVTAADGSRWLGTGWLAGPRTVITAGHCVYLHRHGGWAGQIEVAPGQNGDQLPYGSTVATSFRSVSGWVRGRHPGSDYGAIILPADRAFGNLLGYFGYANPGDLELQGATLDLAGYPCDRPRATMWRHTRRLDYLTPRTLEYAVDSIGGHSGAPIWRLHHGAPVVVGIHTNGDQFGSAATRITAPVFANIGSWQREGA